MTIMLEKLYDALRGVAGEEKARAAAVEAAEFQDRLNRVEADLTLLKWMVGTNVVLTLAILAKLMAGM
jgi:hypothetical protein